MANKSIIEGFSEASKNLDGALTRHSTSLLPEVLDDLWRIKFMLHNFKEDYGDFPYEAQKDLNESILSVLDYFCKDVDLVCYTDFYDMKKTKLGDLCLTNLCMGRNFHYGCASAKNTLLNLGVIGN